MDKPLEKGNNQRTLEAEETNQKNLSEIYCACTRGMLYVSFINKHIKDGWMSFFNFTESEGATQLTSSPSLPMNGDNQDDLHFPERQFLDVRPSNVALSMNEATSLPLIQGASSSASAKREDQEVKTDDITVGVADAVCQGKSDATSYYTSSNVKVLAYTKIFDISKSNLGSTNDNDIPIPTFRPLQTSCGLSEFDPYIYKGGRAPKVPFIVISPDVEVIQDNAFYMNDVIERLVIPKKVTKMGKSALWHCSKLKDVIFEEGSSLRQIGFEAFYNCRMIEEMNLPASLETLEERAFYYCKGPKKVTLSPKMTTIEDQTFFGCLSLTSVEGMNGIQSIRSLAFSGCPSLETIDVNQSADIDRKAFINCNARINRIN
jgi:hypothetical protein